MLARIVHGDVRCTAREFVYALGEQVDDRGRRVHFGVALAFLGQLA